ncbi:MAG TPA: ferritin-like domain-containing protein [Longimicrobiales bacterium]
MELRSLQDLFVLELKDLYNAEQQILDALPRMAEAASHPELRRAFEQHENVTREQVRRLEQIFDDLGESPKGHKCQGMEGLVREGREMIQQEGDPAVRDAGLIGAAQRIEHYEIAGYGTARTFAERLGMDQAARLLQQTLDEEGETDHRLTGLAEQVVNPDAQKQGQGRMQGGYGG